MVQSERKLFLKQRATMNPTPQEKDEAAVEDPFPAFSNRNYNTLKGGKMVFSKEQKLSLIERFKNFQTRKNNTGPQPNPDVKTKKSNN